MDPQSSSDEDILLGVLDWLPTHLLEKDKKIIPVHVKPRAKREEECSENLRRDLLLKRLSQKFAGGSGGAIPRTPNVSPEQ